MHTGPALTVPAVSLPSYVLDGAAARGDKPALVDGPTGRALTYAQLAAGEDELPPDRVGGLERV